jgi:predicted nucleic acid-binding protein
MYLVDTSVWVDFLRGDETPHVRALNDLLAGQEIVGTAPMVLQEILQGADSAERFETWIKYFSDLFCYVPGDPVKSYIAAARLYQDCRRAGNTPRSSNDCLIAQIAIENGLTLLHNDRDFIAIASVVKGLRLYPAK